MWVGRGLMGCVTQSLGWALAALMIVGLAGACGAGANVTTAAGNCAPGDVYCATCSGGGGFCSPQGCPALGCPVGDGGAAADGAADDASGQGSMGDASAQAAVGDAGAETSVHDASGLNGCPAAMPHSCLDCNRGDSFWVGPSPPYSCPPPGGSAGGPGRPAWSRAAA